ncbi:T9SS C-terminal target domain-containing protein [Fibrisoma montanum]|uniref:T9SS C-terminal target domain-containing protein n=1 Tax=Fibrisoma montanum TaxID=2305895 RepID=A0A418M664_9BACT|nr:T9SS type A sorting domain-containing protein [Fibrisoma montanum]RIV21276.1 T9SS C-terminal target domain-containing protein [Fibrisoma montanum]
MKNLNTVLLSGILLLSSSVGWAKAEEPCSDRLRLTQRVNQGEVRQSQAIESLVASNVVASSAKAEYQAGRSVTLLPGFTAEHGSRFEAQVKDCSCDQALLSAESRSILAAYPNPFIEATVIKYRLAEASPVTLSLLNAQGQTVEVLLSSDFQEAGAHEFTYKNASLPASVYLYSLRTTQGIVTKRLVKNR